MERLIERSLVHQREVKGNRKWSYQIRDLLEEPPIRSDAGG